MSTRPELKKYTLNKQIGFDFRTRDEMTIQAYLSLPPQAPLLKSSQVPDGDRAYANLGMIPAVPQKMVVLVHGGPKARDHYGFSPMNAWLTNRGYAVLQVNFRGSTGFGKRLTNAGNGEWGRKMHFDILDAVDFSVSKGIANRSEIAVMGGSYGGYETLVALTFTPQTFACGVDIVGPSNLISLVQAIPPYWLGFYKDLIKMVGADIVTWVLLLLVSHLTDLICSEDGRQSLQSRSPLFFADRVSKPLMIIQGSNDPRVKQAESDQFVLALEKKNIPVTYLLFPDEGHGIRKPHNSMEQHGHIETFLHQCLGGTAQPFQPGQYNSTAIVSHLEELFYQQNVHFSAEERRNRGSSRVACLQNGSSVGSGSRRAVHLLQTAHACPTCYVQADRGCHDQNLPRPGLILLIAGILFFNFVSLPQLFIHTCVSLPRRKLFLFHIYFT